MTNKIQIPATIEAAGTELRGISAVLNTRGWARAAIVYAFTKPETTHGGARGKSSSGLGLSTKEFAALEFPGLRSHETVRHYRAAWQSAIDNGWTSAAAPGAAVIIPDGEFPPAVRPGVAAGEPVEDRRPLDRVRSDSRKLTPRQKAEVVAELRREPEVLRELVARDKEKDQAATARREKQEQDYPELKKMRQADDDVTARYELAKANVNLSDALFALQRAGGVHGTVAGTHELLDTTQRYVDAIRSVLDGGGIDVIEAFANTGGEQ